MASFLPYDLTVGAALPAREAVALRLRKLPAPSSYSAPVGEHGWWSGKKTRGFAALVRCHRSAPSAVASSQQGHDQPVGDNLGDIPVTLMDPALAQLAEDCESLEPTAADCRFTLKVSTAMSLAYPDGESRAEALWDLLRSEFGISLTRIKLGSGETDGSVMGYNGNGLVLQLGVKNEIGCGGGSVHIENAAFSALFAAQEHNKLARDKSVCPTLLMEVAGPNMSLSGSVFAACSLCDQLTPMVSLLWMPRSPLMLQAARCFGALRKALRTLSQFYLNINNAPSRRMEYPYPNTFRTRDGGQASFDYTLALTPRCFTAKCTSPPTEGAALVVKFSRTYSAEAHAFAADAGFAPRLLDVQRLPAGWLMVVMELVQGAAAWGEDSNAKGDRNDQLVEAVRRLHAGGWVHGDLRQGNVLLAADSGRVVLVDFDWAGRDGEARYPHFMNEEVPWPEGASDGEPITPTHDLYWVQRLLTGQF